MAPVRVILMSCGSYNPPTNMHLRMFEIARDHLHRMGTHVVVGGVISPVHDAYAKKELASAMHRCSMLRLALQNNDWIRLSTWETRQNCWTKTRMSLQHHQNLLNSILSNSNDVIHHLRTEDTDWIPENLRNSSDNTPIQIKLLCGADLLESFGVPGLWLEEDMDAIVGEHGLVVITREGSNPNKFIYDSDILSKHMHNICIVTEWIPNEVSSTRIRRALKRCESVRYLLPDSVIDYIYKHEIYDARAPDTTIKLELPSPNANNYLHIDSRYLTAFLTPSPSDVIMDSPSPLEIITASIDVPDAVLRKNLQNAGGGGGGGDGRLDEAREQFINSAIDNGNVKHVARGAYPGQAKQIIANKTGIARLVEVGPLDESRLRSDPPSEEDRRATVEGIARDKVKIEQRQVSDFRSQTDTANVVLGSSDDREIIVKILPDLPGSSSRLTEEHRRFVAESNVRDKETSSLKSKAEVAGVGPDEIILKIQPGLLSSSETLPAEDCKSVMGHVIKGKAEGEQGDVSQSRSRADVVGLGSDNEVIVRVQPGPSITSEMILSEAHKSTVKCTGMDEVTRVGQKEGLDCCWPTREHTASDKIKLSDKRILSTKELFDTEFYLEDGSALASKRMHDNESTDQSDDLNETELGNSPAASTIKTDNASKEINVKKEMADAKPISRETDNVVKVQPAHSSRNVAVTKEDNRRSMTEQLADTKIISEERKNRCEENVELSNADRNDADSAAPNSERRVKTDVKTDDTEISLKEIADLELGEIKHPESRATSSLNVSLTSLDGRHECALSDFGVDKEDFRLSQYRSDEEEEGERRRRSSLRAGEGSSLTKHDQREDAIDTVDSIIADNEASAKKNDTQSCDSQVSTATVIHKSHREKRGSLKTEERAIDHRARPVEEVDQSRFTEEGSSPRVEIKKKADAESRQQREVFQVTDNEGTSITEKAIPCDPNPEIDGKYLKSIVNSRKSPRKIREGQVYDSEVREQQRFAENRQILPPEGFHSPPGSIHTKTKSPERTERFQSSESEREFQDQDKSLSDRELSRSEKTTFQRSPRSSISISKSPNKRLGQIIYRSSDMKDYDRSVNDRVISQLQEVFQDSSKRPSAKLEGAKTDHESYIETRKQSRSVDGREALRFEDLSQRSLRTSSLKSPRKAREQRSVKLNESKGQRGQEKAKEPGNADDKTKQNLKDIKDVYTRKVRRYNVPLQGSLDSMIVSDETNAQKPKKDDAFSKKSKSYESIKRIQEVFLGVPPSKANSSGSQLDIPDEFCSICCYMNEITFRTEEEVSSPNQETFYTLRSNCSSLGDDDSIECDICESLNLQEQANDLDDKGQEMPCELCRICGEVDGSYEQTAQLPDRYAFKVVESRRDDDDSFEIENCGFQSGTESADDRSRLSDRGKFKDAARSKSQSLFIHGSSMSRDQPRELYFIPKDEIAILTSGARRIGRKGSLFRKKEDLGESARDNRRYSSVDSLQLAKISSKVNDKLKAAKDPTLVGSADTLIARDPKRRSKSLQRSTDDVVDRLNSSADNLMENLAKETEPEGSARRKSSIRDKEAVKMILTQHGIKIISEKETAL